MYVIANRPLNTEGTTMHNLTINWLSSKRLILMLISAMPLLIALFLASNATA